MKRWITLGILLLVGIIMAGCTVEVIEYGGIMGAVIDSYTNRPIPNAKVEVGGKSGWTNPQGIFEMSGVRAGRNQIITISGTGYETLTKRVDIYSGRTAPYLGEEAFLLDPSRPNKGAVEGYVYILSGSQPRMASLQEAEVLFFAEPAASSDYVPLQGATVRVAGRTFTTDSRGYFLISDITPDPSPYELIVTHSMFRFDVKRNVTISPGQTTRLGDILGSVGHYIVIGIEKYDYLGKVDGPIADADLFYETLLHDTNQRLAVKGYKLFGSSATKRNIENKVKDVANAAGPDDYIVIYFAGISGHDFLSPYDARPNVGWSTDITDGELEGWLNGFRGTNVTLIIDGAFSETFADGLVLRPAAFRKNKYTVLAGARSNQMVNYDPSLGNSVFTHFLVKGIRTKMADSEPTYGEITGRELWLYTKEEMRNYYYGNTDEDYHEPTFHEGMYGDYVIYRYNR